MAYGDNSYQLIYSGSVGASSNEAHGLFAAYGGLSTLTGKDVIHIQIMASANDLVVLPSSSDDSPGMKLQQSGAYYYDLPPMRASYAAGWHFKNAETGSNARAWVSVWKRVIL